MSDKKAVAEEFIRDWLKGIMELQPHLTKQWGQGFNDKWMKEYMESLEQQQWDRNFDKIIKTMMLNSLAAQTPYVERAATNVNIKMPIDPDGQALALLDEIIRDCNDLRKLIISRGRE